MESEDKKKKKREGGKGRRWGTEQKEGFAQKRERWWARKERDSWESPLSTHASDKLANPVDTIGTRLCLGADQRSGKE